MTTQAMIESDTFQAAFEALDTQSPLHELRSKGFERFRELGFPTRRDEDWRYTNIKPITSTSFTPASGSITKESITPYTLSDTPCHQMVFVIEFETMAKLDSWHSSDEYQALVSLREEGSNQRMVAYEEWALPPS